MGTTFSNTFDIVHGGFLEAIGSLLDAGVKVHLVHGDRDYPCNWVGGEAASLAVPYSRAAGFARAGYAPLQVVTTTTSTSREEPEHVHDGPATVKEAGMTRWGRGRCGTSKGFARGPGAEVLHPEPQDVRA